MTLDETIDYIWDHFPPSDWTGEQATLIDLVSKIYNLSFNEVIQLLENK